eukprot:UN25196
MKHFIKRKKSISLINQIYPSGQGLFKLPPFTGLPQQNENVKPKPGQVLHDEIQNRQAEEGLLKQTVDKFKTKLEKQETENDDLKKQVEQKEKIEQIIKTTMSIFTGTNR